MYQTIELERAKGYALITFNRPERLNALTPQLIDEFVHALGALDADAEIQAVIITGKGRAFCSGLDVDILMASGDQPFRDRNPAAAISNFRGAVIAAINGAAATGGFEMTVACDIILAAESARFVDTHSRIGLVPGWGLSARLQRAIGIYRAKELEMTGRPLFAREAEAWGLVNRVLPDRELLPAARAMAEMIAAGAPGIVAPTKALIDGGSRLPLGEALKFEQDFAEQRNLTVEPDQILVGNVGSRGRR
ncbi:MAG: enoyl-CoA hydratase-related protein [Sulfuricaulis sp.]|nr:enoyl-CoA hydratase-related protein [Sulfuricaulis sp.]